MTLSFDRHDKQTFGTAVGTQGIATSATLQLSDDDVYSMTVSDGTQVIRLGYRDMVFW